MKMYAEMDKRKIKERLHVSEMLPSGKMHTLRLKNTFFAKKIFSWFEEIMKL